MDIYIRMYMLGVGNSISNHKISWLFLGQIQRIAMKQNLVLQDVAHTYGMILCNNIVQ